MENNLSSGDLDKSVSDADLEKEVKASGKDTVSHDTYKKTVGEVKRLKEQLKEALTLKEKLAELEQNEQIRLGKHEETIASLRADLDKTKKGERAIFQKFALRSLGQQVREEGLKHGCVDPDALMKLADLSDIEIDAETFEADKEKVAEIISGIKGSKPYLFSKAGPKINSGLPNGEVKKEKEIDFKKMSASEITDWLNKNRG